MSGDGKLEYIKTGDGKSLATWAWRVSGAPRGRVVLLHGFGQNVRTWVHSKRSFPAFLNRYGFEVIAVEFRGVGASRRAGAHLPTGFGEYLRWDLPAIWESLLEKPSVVIGHSVGGLWALYTALHCSDRVLGAAAWASPKRLDFPGGLRWARRPLESLGAFTWLDQVARIPFPFGALGSVASFMIRNGIPGLMDHRSLPFAWGSVAPDEMVEHYDLGFESVSLGHLHELNRWHRTGQFAVEGVSADLHRDLAGVTTPVLLVSSAGDRIVRQPNAMEAMDLPRALVTELPGKELGHLDVVLSPEAEAMLWPEVVRWIQACCAEVSHSSVAVGP